MSSSSADSNETRPVQSAVYSEHKIVERLMAVPCRQRAGLPTAVAAKLQIIEQTMTGH